MTYAVGFDFLPHYEYYLSPSMYACRVKGENAVYIYLV
jgi:hypothetical protein